MYNKKLFFITFLAMYFIILLISIVIVPKIEKNNFSIFEEYYNEYLDKFEKENNELKQSKKQIDVVFIGDSITVGFEHFTDYFSDYNCLYRGIGGDDTFRLYDRLDVSLYQVKPKVIVLCIGGNNIYTMFDNYVDIIISISKNLPDTKVIIHSIYPTNKSFIDRNKVIPDINNRIKNIVTAYNYIYVDTHSKMVNESNAFNLAYTDDGAHPNFEGYKIIVETIKPFIDDCLK